MRTRLVRVFLPALFLAGCTDLQQNADDGSREQTPAGRTASSTPVQQIAPTVRAFDGSALPGIYHFVAENGAVNVVKLAVRGQAVVGTIDDSEIAAELVADGCAKGRVLRPDTRAVIGAIAVATVDGGLGVALAMLDPRTGGRGPEGQFVFARGAPTAAARAQPRRSSASTQPASGAAMALVGREFGHSSFYSSGSSTTVYHFFDGGVVSRREMTSTSFGGGMDSTKRGRYAVSGSVVTISVDGDQSQAQIVVEGGRITGLRFGSVTYDLN